MATIVAALLGFGVVLGFAAVSIDVGSLMWERRQVQNGADASALALAQTCAETPAACTMANSTTTGMLTQLNNVNNSKDAAGGFDTNRYPNGVCGKNVSTLANCGATDGTLRDCPAVPSSLDASVPYVEVHTQTREANGSSILPTWLIQTLTGQSPQARGTRMQACARAAWGPAAPTSLTVFPIVMSYCDWANKTGYTGVAGSAVYPAGPLESITPYGYGTTPAAPNSWSSITERKIFTKGNETTCTTWNGHSAPGNFYSIASAGCTSNQNLGGWVQGTTGNSSPCTGIDAFKGQVIHIPVFDCLQGGPITITSSTDCTGQTGANKATGTNTYYHIMGYAAFYVTGWYFSNTSQPSIKTGLTPCTGGDRCVSGWFLKDIVSEADIAAPTPGGPPNTGLTAIKSVG
ncbi:Tad domain-containing protein [Phycicoccus sp. SLBN-51]|uniref:pilus assembly protein TadG-related protein n=1 Tax=Phycicoccus sp. SLBN-51 TaxID=2768447 RepID=UPI00135BC0D6|nr:Tad domain-containing protein [Phycicoccus sp. SLBN-51]